MQLHNFQEILLRIVSLNVFFQADMIQMLLTYCISLLLKLTYKCNPHNENFQEIQ